MSWKISILINIYEVIFATNISEIAANIIIIAANSIIIVVSITVKHKNYLPKKSPLTLQTWNCNGTPFSSKNSGSESGKHNVPALSP